MLSIGSATGDYYTSLAREDYYHKGGEPPGQWYGEGAKELGLTGEVNKDQFTNLCKGYSPSGEIKLVQNAGAEKRREGYDLTFSAPKSVSVIWSQADQNVRTEIQQAQQAAVEKTLSYVESEGGLTRRGKKGEELEHGKLIISTYEHGTSRAQDPQLHTHSFVQNIVIRDDGTTGSLESKRIFQHKMAAGALYRAELAAELEKRLGVQIERNESNRTFEVSGVPKELTTEFSKRREAIEAAMENVGAKGAARAAYFTLSTREIKQHVAREILFKEWQKTGKEYGFNFEQVINQITPQTIKQSERESVVKSALDRITSNQAYFTERDLVRRIAEEAPGRGLTIDEIQNLSATYLKDEAVTLGRREGDRYYTTKEIDALEKRMLSQAEVLSKTAQPELEKNLIVTPMLNDSGATSSSLLSEEQKQAFNHITKDDSSLAIVSGMAGTGKTTLLKEANERWKEQGYEVRGASLAAIAAKGLEEGTGIKSQTIARTLLDLDNGNGALNERTILVVDEAGMVGTQQMARLIDEVHKSGAKIVLVGDEKQLQPIEHGAPFKSIGERTGQVELTDIKRQRAEWARKAVKDFAAGRAEAGLASYAERGLMTVTENRSQAMRELIKDWSGDETDYKDKIILSGTRAEAHAFNQMAQKERELKGELKENSIKVNRQNINENDRVLFTKNNRQLSVNNGDLGTVTGINERLETMTVKLANGQKVVIPTKTYKNVELGYAVTTHKAQGGTFEKSYVLLGGQMQDRELSYVQMSRAREEARIYTERADVGDNITKIAREHSVERNISETIKELGKQMNKSRQKGLAQDIKAKSKYSDEKEPYRSNQQTGSFANKQQPKEQSSERWKYNADRGKLEGKDRSTRENNFDHPTERSRSSSNEQPSDRGINASTNADDPAELHHQSISKRVELRGGSRTQGAGNGTSREVSSKADELKNPAILKPLKADVKKTTMLEAQKNKKSLENKLNQIASLNAFSINQAEQTKQEAIKADKHLPPAQPHITRSKEKDLTINRLDEIFGR